MTTEEVMQMMMAGPGASNMSDHLAALAQSNPTMAPLVQRMQERMAAQEREAKTIEAVDDAVAEPVSCNPVRPSRDVVELKKIAKQMYAELEILRSRNDMLADALGGCHLCWGEDSSCPECTGDGMPGAFMIDKTKFQTVVGRAMQQVRKRPTEASPKGEHYAL